MDAGRGTLSERRAIERTADTLLVHGVAGLVQCREQRVAKVVSLTRVVMRTSLAENRVQKG